MNILFNQGLRQGLLARRDRLASILENLDFQELEIRRTTRGHKDNTSLNRLNMLESLDDWYHRELIDLDNALARLDKGNFGICLGCGSALDTNWIDVFPEGEFCRDCEDMKKWMKLG